MLLGVARFCASACGLVVLFLAPGGADAFDFAQERSKAAARCAAIDPAAQQSGLIFNPDGYRSYYVRSQCFQDEAVRFRDATLCSEVSERRSVLWSSWGYSEKRCRQLVAQGSAADRRALEDIERDYVARGISLRDFRIERNGNGRDYDIIPAFDGNHGHGYGLTFEIAHPGRQSPTLLHSSGYHLTGTSNLRLYVRAADIRQRLPAFAPGQAYTVRATLVLDTGFGGQSGYWSPALIERVFPARQRSQVVTRRVPF